MRGVDTTRTLRDILGRAPVIPVLTFDRVDDAVPTARALVAGGLSVLEVTLRSDAALTALGRIAEAVPDAVVGAGTVTRPEELQAARQAGARFAVSPGLTPALATAAREGSMPFMPGVMTPSEALIARDHGFTVLKLFPARAAGGVPLLAALGGPLPELRFCPTGGIDGTSFRAYLALDNVIAVGGSWVAPAAAITAGDWTRITKLAAEACA